MRRAIQRQYEANGRSRRRTLAWLRMHLPHADPARLRDMLDEALRT